MKGVFPPKKSPDAATPSERRCPARPRIGKLKMVSVVDCTRVKTKAACVVRHLAFTHFLS